MFPEATGSDFSPLLSVRDDARTGVALACAAGGLAPAVTVDLSAAQGEDETAVLAEVVRFDPATRQRRRSRRHRARNLFVRERPGGRDPDAVRRARRPALMAGLLAS